MKLATRLRIMLPIYDTSPLPRGSAGTGRRARLRIWCSNAWGFESPLPHYLNESLSWLLLKDQLAYAWPTGLSFANALGGGYRIELPTVPKRPIPVMVSLAMSGEVAAGAAGELSLGLAPSMLPEYAAEVVS